MKDSKQKLSKQPILGLLSFNEQFIVETDAWKKNDLIAFSSQAFSDCDILLSIYEKELMDLVFANV